MSEQFAFDKPGWNSSAIETYERSVSSWTEVMYCARNQFLPGARLAVQQDSRSGRGDNLDLVKDIAQSGALAYHGHRQGKMIAKSRTPCEIDVAEEIQQGILDCDDKACDDIGAYLDKLQYDPLPEDRQETKTGFFYTLLPCGYFVSWEVRGDLIKLVSTGDCRGIELKILGVGRETPE